MKQVVIDSKQGIISLDNVNEHCYFGILSGTDGKYLVILNALELAYTILSTCLVYSSSSMSLNALLKSNIGVGNTVYQFDTAKEALNWFNE